MAKTQGNDYFDVYLKGAPELVASLSHSETSKLLKFHCAMFIYIRVFKNNNGDTLQPIGIGNFIMYSQTSLSLHLVFTSLRLSRQFFKVPIFCV